MIEQAKPETAARRAKIDWRPRGWRLGVVRELLGDLDSVTAAGQRFTMEKVVVMLGDEVGAVEAELNELQRRIMARALADLRRERDRPAPDADIFVVRSQIIADTLALV
jgi:hypothetical protein